MMKIGLHKKTYEELQQTVTELVLEKRKLEKAIEKACEKIAELAECDECCSRKSCPLKTIGEHCHCECGNPKKWKDWCVEER